MKKVIILLICVTVVALAGAIQDGTLKASSDGDNVTVQWQSTEESSVKVYEVQRRSGTSGEFTSLGTVQKVRSNYLYKYIDRTAFKTTGTIYQYRVKIVFNNNSAEHSSEITISHNVSSVKRTWGSLKAMFR